MGVRQGGGCAQNVMAILGRRVLSALALGQQSQDASQRVSVDFAPLIWAADVFSLSSV